MPADRFLHPKAGHSDKVTRLSHFEYRVWTQYLISADDFGVMRATAVTLQADNDALAKVRPAIVQAAIETLVSCGLLRAFEHQGRRFVYQHDWQEWQKVEFPRLTHSPKPPGDALAVCSEITIALFEKHPGGQRRIRNGPIGGGSVGNVQASSPVRVPNDSGDVQDARAVHIPTTRARAHAERLTANANGLGERLAADDGEDGHAAFMRFQAAYPEQRRKGGRMVQEAFLNQLRLAGGSTTLFTALANHQASEQWRDPNMVPGMDTWLTEERWRQVLPARGQAQAAARIKPAWATAAKPVVQS